MHSDTYISASSTVLIFVYNCLQMYTCSKFTVIYNVRHLER